MIIFQKSERKVGGQSCRRTRTERGETLWSEVRCAFLIFHFFFVFLANDFSLCTICQVGPHPSKKVTRRDLNISNNSEKVACRCAPSLYQCSLLLLLHPSSSLARQSPLVLYRTTLMSLLLLSVYPSHSHSHPELELLFNSPTPTRLLNFWRVMRSWFIGAGIGRGIETSTHVST